MSSDFAEIWYTKVFEGAESKNMSKFWSELFWTKKLSFLGVGPPKSDRKLKLSDFDEIWYPGVFEGADFKNRIHFLRGIIFSGSIVVFGSPVPPKNM